jgi:plasmid stability protein
MASMTIRNIDDALKSRLRIRAAQHGRSMEEEARDILKSALATTDAPPVNLVASIRQKVEKVGGIDIELPPRTFVGEPIDFGE